MNKMIFAALAALSLTACDSERDNVGSSGSNSCNSPTPTHFFDYETPTTIEVNFLGSTIGACAGKEIPIVVSGTYSYTTCNNVVKTGYRYSTNPADMSIKRIYNSNFTTPCSQTQCFNYNTLDCSNFVFNVQDETTGATVGEVTDSCNVKLYANAGARTVVKARNKTGTAFYPAAGTLTPNNVLTCN